MIALDTSVLDTLLWVALPYVAIVVFIGGLIWRYRTNQFGWTSRSSQWNERTILRWASPLFHLGILCVAGGHIVGLAIPQSWTTAVGINEHMYHMGATILGSVAAVATIIGLIGLLYRRLVVKSVRLATSRSDIVVYILLCIAIALGTTATIGTQVLGDDGGYNYRETISVWFRSIPFLHPQIQLMAEVPLAYKMHIVAGMIVFCAWPFTRLVHVVSAPVEYTTRPHVVYRSRKEGISSAPTPRGW